jgi:hypothetical protein
VVPLGRRRRGAHHLAEEEEEAKLLVVVLSATLTSEVFGDRAGASQRLRLRQQRLLGIVREFGPGGACQGRIRLRVQRWAAGRGREDEARRIEGSSMSAHVADAWPEPGIEQALMDAADAIADMAQRVQFSGLEVTYASEKLAYALYKAAEGFAPCGVEIDEVTAEVCRGHEHGVWLQGAPREEPRAAVPFVIYPVSREDARLGVTSADNAVVVNAAHGQGAAGLRLTPNEARVLANVLNAAARRVEGRP